MIDTMHLFYQLTTNEFNLLYRKIKKLSGEYHKPFYPAFKGRLYSRYITICLMNCGIMELALAHSTKNISTYSIEVKLHPKILLEPQNYHDVSTIDDLLLAREKFDELIWDIADFLPDFLDWSCRRIDYAVNITTHYADQYIALFKRGNIARYFSDSIEKMLQYDGSFYITTKRNDLTINFYNKENQAKKRLQGSSYHNLTDLTPFKNILRLEIQCGKKKLDRLKAHFSLPTTTLRSYIAPDIAHYVISYYYNLITGNCNKDFLSHEKIKEILPKKSALSDTEISNIISFFAMQESSQGLWDIRKQYFKKDPQFHKMLSLVRICGIHPLSIPATLNIGKLPNLNKKIRNQIFCSKKILRL